MAEKIKCEVPEDVKDFVLAAVDYQNSSDDSGGSWYCSSLISSEDSGPNSKKLKLALCMGEMCTMKEFMVNKSEDGTYTAEESGGGMF
mmetsp:Transcript_8213/g.10392  ORF Transcript_8213/g.10392 Transcript_8213/m.10392 type:complete len:88 (+) Transcript_8213:418-681(+)|eukprot:CAMPEP_0204844684 /NCGR_PEP_ID=MMETSP1347-20130617/450_1 /ASSEMBLY_ACC=CAM_ASM_000690 /TAXON_ID=215587 /ORGANISM="Aplanochytrium stocchinoi, Strain GSBS06" /LENGTH=87 /DNA_ID=CAMNT_0051984217 /DNA_START=191 /DNA_END=454 /DNA_ORIENTATION=+